MLDDTQQDMQQPGDVEALLPWYAVGRLRRRDRRHVEEALRNDQALAQHVELVREELDETIRLNETLGAPSSRAMDRLMAAIDADEVATRKRGSLRAAIGWFTQSIASFSPRTLAMAACLAALAIALQASMLVGMLTKPQDSAVNVGHVHGTFAMVRFTRQANAAEITDFLQNYQATVVDGPKPGGLYRVRLAMTTIAKEELGRIVSRMQHERVVEFAEPSE
jgi:anti-sigma-K factor RskA